MGKLKNSLQERLESDSLFADRYWHDQERWPVEPEFSVHQSINVLETLPTTSNHQLLSSCWDDPPF